MKREIKKEIDDLLLAGQDLSPEIFRKNVKLYSEGKSEEEKAEISEYVAQVHISQLKQAIKVTNNLIFLTQLEAIEEFLNFAKIASSYFGKSRTWLYQRLHGYSVHGKPAKFTSEEKKRFSEALIDLSDNIRSVAQEIA